jgi:threonine dehydratase
MLFTVRTPLVRLSNLFPGGRMYAKCEFLAPSGSFKIRGAGHLLAHLTREGGTRQLVVPSMGNTALGAALGAKLLGFSMVGVVPTTISRAKDERLQALGVELVKVAGGGTDLLTTATQLATDRKGYFVHPHLDANWTDGYQLIAEQILEALPDCRSLVFPVGGGGLLMGLTEYFLRHRTKIELIGVEAYNYPTYARFDHPRTKTIADGLVLELPHPKVQERIKAMSIGIHLVKDDDIRTAMRELFLTQGLMVEPSSAITAAFVKAHFRDLQEPVCIIPTGDNITREDFYRLIDEAAA